MKKDLVIIGAGSLGRETYGWISDAIADGAPWRIKGFLDRRPDALAGYPLPETVLATIEAYQVMPGDVFVAAIGNPREKKRAVTHIRSQGGTFVTVIHPLAKVGRAVELGTGVVLAPFSSMDCDLTVGDCVTVLPFSAFGHDTRIGDWCQVSSHCAVNGKGILGQGVFLGSHACVIPQVEVGDWAYVGAGSVVIRGVEPGTKVFGNPARPLALPDDANGSYEP